MANVLAGMLFRKDMLHAMAAGAGRVDEMPAVGSVFKRYDGSAQLKLKGSAKGH